MRYGISNDLEALDESNQSVGFLNSGRGFAVGSDALRHSNYARNFVVFERLARSADVGNANLNFYNQDAFSERAAPVTSITIPKAAFFEEGLELYEIEASGLVVPNFFPDYTLAIKPGVGIDGVPSGSTTANGVDAYRGVHSAQPWTQSLMKKFRWPYLHPNENGPDSYLIVDNSNDDLNTGPDLVTDYTFAVYAESNGVELGRSSVLPNGHFELDIENLNIADIEEGVTIGLGQYRQRDGQEAWFEKSFIIKERDFGNYYTTSSHSNSRADVNERATAQMAAMAAAWDNTVSFNMYAWVSPEYGPQGSGASTSATLNDTNIVKELKVLSGDPSVDKPIDDSNIDISPFDRLIEKRTLG